MKGFSVPIEVSARHLHLTENDFHQLFGADVHMEADHPVSQPGQYAAKQRVKVIGPKSAFSAVAIVGPYREYTQLELSKSDARYIGVDVQLAVSGTEVPNSVPIRLEGPAGFLEIHKDVILPERHLHCDTETAAKYGIKDMDTIKVRIPGRRALVFEEVVVRARAGKDAIALHLDTDEANAAGVKKGDQAEIILDDISAVPQPELVLD